MKVKLSGITNVDFDIIGQQLIISSVSIRYWRKSGGIMNVTVHQLFVDFKKAYDSVRREVLYSILFEFVIPRKLVGLIKVCLNEMYSTVLIDKKKNCVTSFLFRMA
jgi:hypothetical protein